MSSEVLRLIGLHVLKCGGCQVSVTWDLASMCFELFLLLLLTKMDTSDTLAPAMVWNVVICRN